MIEQVHKAAKAMDPTDDKYPKMVAYLDRLYEMKTKSRRIRVSPDTIALIVGNLLGIVVIVAYEQKHVLTSKALNRTVQPERHK